MNPAAILVIDDDEEDRMILKDSFPPHLVDAVSFFESGEAVLNYLVNVKDEMQLPRLVISDLNMPVINGLDLLKKVKAHPVYKEIEFVILSTAAKKSNETACLQLGASAYFEKPYSRNEFRVLAQEFIKLAQL